jgi:hypothetical protein
VRRFARRLLGASLLHADTYEEVEADRASIRQALLVVAAAALAGGVASYIVRSEAGLGERQLALQVTISALLPVVIWIGGSAFSFMVGASFFRSSETETDFPEVLRTTGFAVAPALLRVFAFLPPPALGLSIDLGAQLWSFAAVVVAIRQALDFGTMRAIGTFGFAAVLLWLVLWGLSVAPLPL